MSRTRTLKGKFFQNEVLGHMPPFGRLLFIGLWTIADRDGRLEDRPARIVAEVFPYDRDLTEDDVDHLLMLLDVGGLIVRYQIDGLAYIEIVKWKDHQHPHPREVPSTIPPFNGSENCKRSQHLGSAKVMSGNGLGDAKATPRYTESPAGSTGSTGPTDLKPLLTTSVVCKSRSARKNASRAARLADGWKLPLEWGQWAMHECGMAREQVERTAATFADYWHARAGAGALKVDWLATWRNWCRREQGEFRAPASNGGSRHESLQETRRRTAEGFGVAPRDRDTFDLPPEDCHVVGSKH